MKGCLIIIISTLFSSQIKSQTIAYSPKAPKILLKSIIGTWAAKDTTLALISFVRLSDNYVQIEGIKHGVGNYGFSVENDSVKANGIAINWPPYYCLLNLENSNLLRIDFYLFHSNAKTSKSYTRP